MDYFEDDYEEDTPQEKMVTVLKFFKNECVVRQNFRKGAPDKPNFEANSDTIVVWRKSGGSDGNVEPEIMQKLIERGLMDFRVEDLPDNEHFRRFVYFPLEPQASKFLEGNTFLVGTQ